MGAMTVGHSSNMPDWRLPGVLAAALLWALAGGLSAAESGTESGSGEAGAAAVVDVESGVVEQEVPPPVAPPAPPRPQFGGAWEKDFARSDRWEDELTRRLDQLRRDAERGYQLETRRVQAAPMGNRRSRSGANIVELAQLTGFINRQTTLRIQQSAVEIRIERTGDADLVCSTLENITYSWEDITGEEVCGWEGGQLLFSINLPEGVQILHRFSLADNGQWLNMATTTSSASATFTQIQFFYRYDAPSENYTCIQTISRGNTCSLGDSVLYD